MHLSQALPAAATLICSLVMGHESATAQPSQPATLPTVPAHPQNTWGAPGGQITLKNANSGVFGANEAKGTPTAPNLGGLPPGGLSVPPKAVPNMKPDSATRPLGQPPVFAFPDRPMPAKDPNLCLVNPNLPMCRLQPN